jgi:hypothetical protein
MGKWRSRVAAFGVLAVWLLALAACKKEGELPPGFGPQRPAVDVDKLQAPALFAHIPADTPYVVAAFEATPLDYLRKLKRTLGPAMGRTVDQLRSLADDSELARWIDAVTDELDGKWTVKGLESLGLSARPRFAIYGHGVAPVVLRIEVKDARAVLAAVERIAARAGAKLPALETRHGREFWRIELPGETGAIVALADNQLVAAFGPRHAIAAVLPQIVGAEKPSRNMADGKQLKDLIARHRLGPQLIGYVDAKRLAKDLLALAERAAPAECTAEIDRLAAQVPRLVFSYTEISDKRHAGGVILELAPALAEQLKALRTAVPGLAAALADAPAFAMGGGLDLARARTAGKAMANVMRDLGDACEARTLVRAARELRDAMTEPLPGPFAKLTGAAVAVDSIDFGQGKPRRGYDDGPSLPRDVDGFAMFSTSDGKASFEAFADELPPIHELGVKADGKLHAIELTKFGLPFDVHGGVGQEVLAVSVGSRGKRRAEKALAQTGGGKAPFFAGTFDMTKLLELQRRFDSSSDLTRDLDDAMAELFGRTTLTIDATDAGLAIWYSTEIK